MMVSKRLKVKKHRAGMLDSEGRRRLKQLKKKNLESGGEEGANPPGGGASKRSHRPSGGRERATGKWIGDFCCAWARKGMGYLCEAEKYREGDLKIMASSTRRTEGSLKTLRLMKMTDT